MNTKKTSTVNELTQSLKSFNVIALANYISLTHKQLETMRSMIKEAHGDLKIVKNSLLKRALKETGNDQNENKDLVGPTAVVLAHENDLTPLSVLHKALKEIGNFTLKGGIWNNGSITKETVLRLATLPTRTELISRLLAQMKTPSTKLVLTLKNPLNRLAIVLKAISEKQITQPQTAQ